MIRSIKQFAKCNYRSLMIVNLIFLIYFVPYLGNLHVGVDTLFYINYPSTNHNWLDIGRQGGILIHKLFFQSQYSMFFAQGMALITYLLAAFVLSYLLYSIAEVSAWKSGLFFLFMMIHPVWAEQFYFTLQIFEIAVGVLLTGVALLLAYGEKRWNWIASIVLQMLIFSIYQTFIAIYIAGCILCFLLQYIQETRCGEGKTTARYLKCALRQIVQFIIAFAINMAITKEFFSSSDYLTGQVRWGTEPAFTCIKHILSHIKQVFWAEGIFYTCSYAIFSIAAILLIVFFLWKHRTSHQGKSIFLLAALVLQLTPFLLTIYGGTIPVFRSQYILPFVIACDLLLILELIPHDKTALRSLVCIISIFMLISQYYQTSQLQYTHFFVRQEDERRALSIEEQIITAANGMHKPVAFIGYWPARMNGAYTYAEITHQSIFQFEWSEPRYQELTKWCVEYMKSQGISITPASAEQIQEARHIASEMPSYPLEGSVRDAGDFVIVKLTPDDYYALEAMPPNVKHEQKESVVCANDILKAYIDEVYLDNGILTIRGWALKPGLDSTYSVQGVHLWDENAKVFYSLASGPQSREDLTHAFADGTNYSHAGVLAKAPREQLPNSLEHCRIILSVSTADGEIQYFDTGAYVQEWLDK